MFKNSNRTVTVRKPYLQKGITISIYNGRPDHKCSWMRTGVISVELKINIKEIEVRCFISQKNKSDKVMRRTWIGDRKTRSR